MNDVRPLLWVSDSALERLRLAVQQRVDQWAQSWGLPNTDPARVALWHHGDDAVSADLATAEGLPPAWASALSKTLFKGSGMRSAIVGPVLTDCHEQLRAAACPPPRRAKSCRFAWPRACRCASHPDLARPAVGRAVDGCRHADGGLPCAPSTGPSGGMER